MEQITKFNEALIDALEAVRELNSKLESADKETTKALRHVQDVVAHSHLERTLEMISEDMDLRLLLNHALKLK